MLAFQPVFDLASDLIPLLEGGYGVTEIETEEKQRSSSRKKMPNITVVGQEPGGRLVITWNGTEKNEGGRSRTFIGVYNTRERTVVVVYSHHNVTNVVASSISSDGNLLAFTTLARYEKKMSTPNEIPSATPLSATQAAERKRDRVTEDVYDTYLAEIHPVGKRYTVGSRSKDYQRLQFLPNERKRKNCFIFINEKSSIELHEISTDEKGKILAQPEHLGNMVKRFLWYEYVPDEAVLYYIPQRLTQKLEGFNVMNTMIRCLAFRDRSWELVWDVPLQLKLPLPSAWEGRSRKITLGSQIGKKSSMFSGFYPASNGTQVGISLVRMRRRCCCLVVERGLVGSVSSGSLCLSIHVLHARSRRDLEIPADTADAAGMDFSRPLFTVGSLADLVFVYLPGHVIIWLDCAAEHEMSESLTMSGPKFAPLLPSQRREGSTPLGQVELLAHALALPFSQPIREDVGGMSSSQIFWDLAAARGIEVRINRVTLMETLIGGPPKFTIPLLHLGLLHLEDIDGMEMCISAIARTNPSRITPEILQEFLVGCVNVQLRQRLFDPMLLASLPMSSMKNISTHFPLGENVLSSSHPTSEDASSLSGSQGSANFDQRTEIDPLPLSQSSSVAASSLASSLSGNAYVGLPPHLQPLTSVHSAQNVASSFARSEYVATPPRPFSYQGVRSTDAIPITRVSPVKRFWRFLGLNSPAKSASPAPAWDDEEDRETAETVPPEGTSYGYSVSAEDSAQGREDKRIKQVMLDCLLDHFATIYPKFERARFYKLAQDVVNTQQRVSQSLFECLYLPVQRHESIAAEVPALEKLSSSPNSGLVPVRTANSSSPENSSLESIFRMLQILCGVLEEINYPRPRFLMRELTKNALLTLSPSVFSQYVHHGVIRIMPDVFVEICHDNRYSLETKFFLASHCVERETALSCLSEEPDMGRGLAEHFSHTVTDSIARQGQDVSEIAMLLEELLSEPEVIHPAVATMRHLLSSLSSSEAKRRMLDFYFPDE